MLNTYNPVLSGIMTAYGLAERIRNAAQDQQKLEFEQAREKRMAEEAIQLRQDRQRTAQLQDLQTRLGLATHPALAEVGPESTRTVEAAISDPALQKAYGAPSVSMGVPTEGALEYGGQRYAVRGEEELLNRELRTKGILSQAENLSEVDKARQMLEATGFSPQPQVASALGLPGRLPQTALPSYMTTAARLLGETPEPAPHYETDDQGNVYSISRTGQVSKFGKLGKSKTATGASGELTASQRVTLQTNIGKELREQEDLEAPLQATLQTVLTGTKKEGGAAYTTVDQKTGETTQVDLDKAKREQVVREIERKLQAIRKRKKGIYLRMRVHGLIGDEQYRQMVADLGAPSTEKPAAPEQAGPAASPAQAAAAMVGRNVRLADGRTVTVKKINPDGTFEY